MKESWWLQISTIMNDLESTASQLLHHWGNGAGAPASTGSCNHPTVCQACAGMRLPIEETAIGNLILLHQNQMFLKRAIDLELHMMCGYPLKLILTFQITLSSIDSCRVYML